MSNDLSQRLKDEWCTALNGPIPDGLKAKSGKKFWWTCDQGHDWRTQVYVRSNGGGCTVCARKKFWRGVTDLVTVLPEWARLWDYEANYPKTPEQVYHLSRKRYTYRCENNHRWQDKPGLSRKMPHCPFCIEGRYSKVLVGLNDLVTYCRENETEDVLKDWDHAKNRKPIHSYSYKSIAKVHWRCEAGHQWEENIRNRAVIGYGCPYCSGQRLVRGVNDLASQNPDLLKMWRPTKNLPLVPTEVAKASGLEIWWLCERGHEWQRTPNFQRMKDGCPDCSPWGTSKREREIFVALADLGFRVSRKPLPIRWGSKSKIRPDINIENTVIVEYDGHYYHGDEESIAADRAKTEALLARGFAVIRFRDHAFLPTLFAKKERYYEINIDETRESLESLMEKLTPLVKAEIELKS